MLHVIAILAYLVFVGATAALIWAVAIAARTGKAAERERPVDTNHHALRL